MNYSEYLKDGTWKADVTRLLRTPGVFRSIIDDISAQISEIPIDLIACVEGRGFLIGSALAYRFNTGLVLFRAPGKIPVSSDNLFSASFVDYSGETKQLELQTQAIKAGEKVLIVDDWVQTGGTIKAAIELVNKAGGSISGIAVFADDSTAELKAELGAYNYTYITG